MGRESLEGKELELWDSFADGIWVDCDGPDPITFSGSPDEGWSPGQRISGELIAQLMRGESAAADGSPAIRLSGARITGQLDLTDAKAQASLVLERCWLDDIVYLDGATIPEISVRRCRFEEISGERLQVLGDFAIESSTLIELDLSVSKIGGSLRLLGSTLTNQHGVALNARLMTVGADLSCGGWVDSETEVPTPFTAVGLVILEGAKVGGTLALLGTTLSNPGGYALLAANLSVGAQMICSAWNHPDGQTLSPFTVDGLASLYGAQITGSIGMLGAQFKGAGGIALEASNLNVGGDMGFSAIDHPDGQTVLPFTAMGAVRLAGARILGRFEMTGVKITREAGTFDTTNPTVAASLAIGGAQELIGTSMISRAAFEATNLTVGSDMTCQGWSRRDGKGVIPFAVDGPMNLHGANIQRSLIFRGVTLSDPGGIALDGGRLTVGTDMIFGVVASGEHVLPATTAGLMILEGAKIGGALILLGTRLANPGGFALLATNLSIGAQLMCTAWNHPDGRSLSPFAVDGLVSIHGAQITGSVAMIGAHLHGAGGIALEASNLNVGGDVGFVALNHPDGQTILPFTADGAVRLAGAKILGRLEMAGVKLTYQRGDLDASNPTVAAGMAIGGAQALLAATTARGAAFEASNLSVGSDMVCIAWDGPDEKSVVPFTVNGSLVLQGANIQRSLIIRGATLSDPDGIALDASNLTVGTDMTCGAWENPDGQTVTTFAAAGVVNLVGARINGSLEFEGATLTSEFATALMAANLVVGSDLTLGAFYHPDDVSVTPLTVDGGVSLQGASISRSVEFAGATLIREGGNALQATRMTVGEDLTFSVMVHPDEKTTTRFSALGAVRLRGANIRGMLNLSGATLSAESAVVLDATDIVVGSDMLCGAWDHPDGITVLPFVANGHVTLNSAKISGAVSFEGATLNNEGGTALEAERISVDESLFFRAWDHADGLTITPFTAMGEVRLYGAKVGGGIDLAGASITSSSRQAALTLDGLQVKQYVYCGPARRATNDDFGSYYRHADGSLMAPFTAHGGISFDDATIGGNLDLDGAVLLSPAGVPAMTAQRLVVAQDLSFDGSSPDQPPLIGPQLPPAAFTFDSKADLTDAKIGGTLWLGGARRTMPGPDPLTGAFVLSGVVVGAVHHQAPEAKRFGRRGKPKGTTAPALVSLDGLTYNVLEPYEPVGRRLAWLRAGSLSGHRPQSYEQLAAYYRRLGHDHEARRVLHAKRVAQTKAATGWRRLWVRPAGVVQNLLSGYGYLPGRALGWLFGALAVGFVGFTLERPPGLANTPFMTGLYTLDVLVPTSPFGIEDSVTPVGAGFWVAAALKALGWGLSLAVLPALARALSRN